MWIELHDTAREHPKILKLARDLGIKPVVALGHMTSLWTWVLRMAPDGCLDSFDDEDVEIAAQWEGEAGAFVASAVNRHLIDVEKKGSRHVHDWLDFAGALKAAGRARASRERKRQDACEPVRDSAALNVTVTRSAGTHQTDRPDPPDQTDVPLRGSRSVDSSPMSSSSAAPDGSPKPSTPTDESSEALDPAGGDPQSWKLDGAEVSTDRTESSTDSRKTTPPKSPKGSSRGKQVDEVYQHYRRYHPRAAAKLGPTEEAYRNIVKRLQEGRTVADLCGAVDGCHRTPFNLGENDKGTKYLDLDLIVRDDKHVTRYLENALNPPKPKSDVGPKVSWRQSESFSGSDVDLNKLMQQTLPKVAAGGN